MKAKRGFTLLELIIVVIIIGILATLGLTQYSRTVEKGRAAEAKTNLGRIRTAQETYKLERGNYTTNLLDLGLDLPEGCFSQRTHYFLYALYSSGTMARAYRCVYGGKPPQFPSDPSYNITLSIENGTWGGTPGYY